MSRRIILASTSPRRRELLKRACIEFDVEAPGIEENMRQNIPPQDLVKGLAFEKAAAVAMRHADAIVIAADTVVALDAKRWSKPKSNDEARMMLCALSGRRHAVWTGFCIIDARTGRKVQRALKTYLTLRKLSRREIDQYIATGEPLEGAGGYKMQEGGGFVIDTISGDYTNVLGLPLNAVLKELTRMRVQP